MNDRENKACQYILECIELFKDGLVPRLQNYMTAEIFPITLDEYPILCSRVIPRHQPLMGMLTVHFMGEELKKRLPDHVPEIELQRVKYLTLIYGQFKE
jgi:hypothetical protein